MGKPKNKNLTPFTRVLGISDFGITADKTLIEGEYTRTGTFTVGAGQEATFGISTLRSGGVEGEPVYMKSIEDTGAAGTAIEGKTRFILTNAQGTKNIVVAEMSNRRLYADETDRTKAFLMPEYGVNALEDSKLCIDINATGSATAVFDYDGTNSLWQIPVTIYQ
jgi:hypothetical protein